MSSGDNEKIYEILPHFRDSFVSCLANAAAANKAVMATARLPNGTARPHRMAAMA